MATIEIKTIDNSEKFLNALTGAVEEGLAAIGLTAESYAKDLCPVDTGRLRNSITNAVAAKEQAVIIGTNVEYAAYVELGTTRMHARPYLRPAVSNHTDEYKALMETALKSAQET